MAPLSVKQSLWASIVAALGASVCCVGPLLLLMLGVSGTWIGNLARMEPVRPYLTVATLALLAWAYHLLYRVPLACSVDSPCADPMLLQRQRRIFWVVSTLLVGLLALPWVAPYFLE